jgi:hypothetical protein
VPSSSSGAPSKPAGSSSDSSAGMTASTVKGPETRVTFFTTSGWSTSSSCSALAAMVALTWSILARQAARYSVSARWSASGQSGSVSNGTSHSCHASFGRSQRRRSASVTLRFPSRFSFSASLAFSCCRSSGVTCFSASFSALSLVSKIVWCFAKIGSSATFCAILFSVMCGTVL